MKKNLLAVTFGFLLSAVMIAALEYAFSLNERRHWFDRMSIGPSKVADAIPYDLSGVNLDYLKGLKPYDQPDDIWTPGELVADGTRRTLRKQGTGRVVYDMRFSLDERGRRVIPAAEPRSKRFLMFLGCSFTWGQGVFDNETFANRLTKIVGNRMAYNLGVGASGPHQALKMLQDENDIRLQGISGDGVAVYTFLSDHLFRVAGSVAWLRTTGRYMLDQPYYFLNGEQLVYGGTYSEARPVLSRFYYWLLRSSIASFFGVNYPTIDEDVLKLFMRILVEQKKILEARYGVKKYVVSIYPGQRWFIGELKPMLEKKGFVIFDFSGVDLKPLTSGRDIILGDGHPSALGHRVYADLLYNEFKKHRLIPLAAPRHARLKGKLNFDKLFLIRPGDSIL